MRKYISLAQAENLKSVSRETLFRFSLEKNTRLENMEKGKTGTLGERIAENYLREQGYRILFKNLRLGKLEIDLVAKAADGLIVIVEVKTIWGSPVTHAPEDNYGYRKAKNIRAAAQKFLGKYEDLIGEVGLRIDLVAINLQKEAGEEMYNLRHYENL